MVQRRRFSAEYKREAVAMLNAPGVSVSQIAAELGIGAAVLGRWRRELHRQARSRRSQATVDPAMKRSGTCGGS